MPQVTPIPAFQDNYIWLIHDDVHAIAVDPGDASVVIDYLKSQHLTLTDILITHHHQDHTGGVTALAKRGQCRVHAPLQTPLRHCHQRVQQGDQVCIESLDLTLNVINLPGHTLDHVGYITDSALFCGDTLFVGGCGRIFEGTAAMMQQSLQKIASLPEQLLIYCAHEYTEANYRFAHTVDPDNIALQEQIQQAQQKRNNHRPTVPSSIAIERATNPFLRCHTDTIRQAVEKHAHLTCHDETEVFKHLRKWKDQFS